MRKKNKMICFLQVFALAAVTLSGLESCQETDEVPPVANRVATGYRMPDPEPLTAADRLVIEAQEREYSENTK